MDAEELATTWRSEDAAEEEMWEAQWAHYECRRKLDILPSEELVQERYLWLEHLACDEFAYEGKFYDMDKEWRQAQETIDMYQDIVDIQRSQWYGMLIECECPLEDLEGIGCKQVKDEYTYLLSKCGPL